MIWFLYKFNKATNFCFEKILSIIFYISIKNNGFASRNYTILKYIKYLIELKIITIYKYKKFVRFYHK